MLPIRVRLQFSSWAHLVGSKMRPLKPKSGGRSAGWMFAFTHKFTCFLIHSPKRKQTYLSASPLSAFYSALNAFSHSLKKKSCIVRLAFAFFSLAYWQGFCMCILWGWLSQAGRCFTGFTSEQLYPPGTFKQTQITLTCLSSLLFFHTGCRHVRKWPVQHMTSCIQQQAMTLRMTEWVKMMLSVKIESHTLYLAWAENSPRFNYTN